MKKIVATTIRTNLLPTQAAPTLETLLFDPLTHLLSFLDNTSISQLCMASTQMKPLHPFAHALIKERQDRKKIAHENNTKLVAVIKFILHIKRPPRIHPHQLEDERVGILQNNPPVVIHHNRCCTIQ